MIYLPAPSFEAAAVQPTTTSPMRGAARGFSGISSAQSDNTALITTAIVAMTDGNLTPGGILPPGTTERH